MNTIQNYALVHGDVNKQNIALLLDVLEGEHKINIDHILAIVLGLRQPITDGDFHLNAVIDGKRCKFEKYDLLKDEVNYSYKDENKLWFKTKEDAEKFADKNFNYYALDYKYSQKDEYQFEGIRPFTARGICSSAEWVYNEAK